ncbi:hypothetical protein ABT075_01740 [Streptomyces sp. NPDC002677]|uniref:hypothetical protein n=1 Tax=Streptomyces sp. NPDC002677 TaxID=3154774 RepID=UPI003329DDE3
MPNTAVEAVDVLRGALTAAGIALPSLEPETASPPRDTVADHGLPNTAAATAGENAKAIGEAGTVKESSGCASQNRQAAELC